MANIITEVGSQLVGKIFGGILWFGIGFIIFSVAGFCMWWFLVYQKKFSIKVKVISC